MAERAHPEDRGFQNRWFGLKRSIYRKKLIERYEFCKKFTKGKIVLDIPCGVGWGTSMIKNSGMLYGLDISPEAVSYASAHYPGNYFVGNMSNLPFKDSYFETIVCLEGFEHVEKNIGRNFLKEARRVTVKDGLVILTCPLLDENGKNSGNPYHLCEYPEDELRNLLKEHFQILLSEKFKGPDGPEIRAVLKNLKKD